MKIEKNTLISIEASDIKKGILKLPKRVTTINDGVIRYNEKITKVIALGLQTIGNYNFRVCNALTQFDAPQLTTIGNDNFRVCNALTQFDAPQLTTIGNYNFYECNALTQFDAPQLTTIGNDNFRVCNALTQFDAPQLTTIGNYNFRVCNALTQFDAPQLTTIGNDNFRVCNALERVFFSKNKFNVKSVDGSLFVIENSKTLNGTIIYNGFNFYNYSEETISKKECYLAEKDGFFAHGENTKQAVTDVNFKAIAEKLKKEPIKADTIITIQYYRTVTGACEMVCREFIERNKLEKTEYRADELLPILIKNNAYGVESFKRLVDFEY